jgi:glycosyltransferase involved in cell wall biosynthesis
MPSQHPVRRTLASARIGINAHLLSSDASYRRAGIHQYIAQLLRHLPLVDSDTHYVIYTRATAEFAERAGFQLASSRWPTDQRIIRILWEQSAWPLLAARDKLDLLHSMAFVTPVLGRIPTIVTVYDLSFVHFPEKFPASQRRYLRSQTARSVSSARRVITISEASRKDLHRFFAVPMDRIDVILPGVESHFRPLPDSDVAEFRQRNGLPERFVLHVGTLQPRKNIPLLLDALARLQRQDVDLVLAGAKGWFYDEVFRQVEELGLVSRVHFAGYVPDEDLPFWYNSAEALVFPSLYEGFGMPIVEAMACGTPVIAAETSSIPEAGGDAALYFDPSDSGDLAQQLTAVLDNKQMVREMRARGLAQAQRFSWQRAGIETARTYARVLAEL